MNTKAKAKKASKSNNCLQNNDFSGAKKSLWDVHFEKLQSYMKKYYPNGGYVIASVPNRKFSSWIRQQRYNCRQRLNGHKTKMSDDRLERLQAIGFLWEQPEDDDGMESAEEPNDETDSSHNDSDDSEYDEDGSHRTVRNSGHEGPSWMELSRRCATQKKEVEQLKAKESACRTLIKQHKKEITLLSCMNQDLMQTSHDVMECNQNLRESHRIAMLEERVHIGRECKKRKLVETKLETSKHQSKETIQKLHSERLTLQSTNASLENENEDLRNRNKELEKRLEILERDNHTDRLEESPSPPSDAFESDEVRGSDNNQPNLVERKVRVLADMSSPAPMQHK